jgi:hypothetical protein
MARKFHAILTFTGWAKKCHTSNFLELIEFMKQNSWITIAQPNLVGVTHLIVRCPRSKSKLKVNHLIFATKIISEFDQPKIIRFLKSRRSLINQHFPGLKQFLFNVDIKRDNSRLFAVCARQRILPLIWWRKWEFLIRNC